MAESDLEEILAACIDDLRADRRSLEECLAANPLIRAELEPLLRLAQQIGPTPTAEIDPIRKRRARLQFIEALHKQRRVPWWRRLWPERWPAQRWRAMPVLAALTLAMVLGTGGTAVLAAAESAQPDDPLYGLKTAIEQVQVAVALSEDARAEAQLQIAERRLAELGWALETGNKAAAARTAQAYQIALAQAEKHLAKAAESTRDVEKLLDRVKTDQGKGQEMLQHANAPEVERPKDGPNQEERQPATTGRDTSQQGESPVMKPGGHPQQKPEEQPRPDPPGHSQDGGAKQPPGQMRNEGDQSRSGAR